MKICIHKYRTIDWVRGILALLVMLYHTIYWSFSSLDSSSFLGRIGIYAVSIFFIISGFSIACSSINKVSSKSDIFNFYSRRLIRLSPIFWIVISCNLLLLNNSADMTTLILNYTFLFSILDHSNYIVTGGWSIGNEIVYYIWAPLLILILRNNVTLLWILMLISITYSVNLMSDEHTLVTQWSNYIQPLNNLYFFIGGMLIFNYIKEVSSFVYVTFGNVKNKILLTLILILILMFISYDISDDLSNIVTGVERVYFSIVSLMIVFITSLLIFKDKPWMILLDKLGAYSYGIYLIHPIVYWTLLRHFSMNKGELVVITTVVLTVFLSAIIYHMIEKPAISLGRKILNCS